MEGHYSDFKSASFPGIGFVASRRKKLLPFEECPSENCSSEVEERASGECSPNNEIDQNINSVCSPNTENMPIVYPKVYKSYSQEVVKDAVMSKEPLSETELKEKEEEDEVSIPAVEEVILEETESSQVLINTKALSKHATTYELEKFEKNALMIFNQVKIDGHKPRVGTKQDVDALTRTFKKFNFEVTVHDDFTKEKIIEEVKKYSESNFTDYGCVAVAILTHGTENGLLRAKDQLYSEIEIINHFKVHNKPTLVTKPKIIIIQACRGTKLTPGAVVLRSGKVQKDLDENLEPYILPVESDMLVLHSSYQGNPSMRDPIHGSWFIQELCSKIDSLAATHDFESIITDVKREVAISKEFEEYNKRTLEMQVSKQMPVVTSTLIRKLYLRKFGDKPKRVETYSDKRPSVSCESRSESIDSSTPLLIQFGPCSCFLDYFNYIRTCLQHYIEEYPDDEEARNYLDIANSLEDGVEFNAVKRKTSKAICKYLSTKIERNDYYKYLYFYKHP